VSKFLALAGLTVAVAAGGACQAVHTQPAHNLLGVAAALGVAVLVLTGFSGRRRSAR
jgi:hypothetical protein